MSSEAAARPELEAAEGAEMEEAVVQRPVVRDGRHTAPKSRWVDLGVPVHYVDHGGPADGPLLVMVHGLGGSLVNWAALAPLLTETCRVIAVDLIGFGHTQAGAHTTSVNAQQQMLQRFLMQVAGRPAILVGNSMGGVITMLTAEKERDSVSEPADRQVAGLVLIDPALPVEVGGRLDPLVAAMFGMYSVPPLGRAMLRARRRVRSPEQIAMDVLRLCCVDPARVPADVLEQHREMARTRRGYPDVDEHFLRAARSLMLKLARRSSYLAMMKSIQVPVLLLHGEKDRLVTIESSRAAAAANPSWRFEVAQDVGHVPQLEVPEWTAGRILEWLADYGPGSGRGRGPDNGATDRGVADSIRPDGASSTRTDVGGADGTSTNGTGAESTATDDIDRS